MQHPPFTSEDTALAAKGGRARAEAMSPERRMMVARQAARSRWYPPTGDANERLTAILRKLAQQVALSLAMDERDEAVCYIMRMLPYERLKIQLEMGSIKDVTPEQNDEIEKKLTQARERREKAMTVEGESK